MADFGTMPTVDEKEKFQKAVTDARNLVWLHASSQQGPGRRHHQPSMSRAAVPLTVAAWQAFVEATASAVVSYLAIPHGQPGHTTYKVMKGYANSAINRFSTANAKNSVDLLLEAGFDPRPAWSFTVTWAFPTSPKTTTYAESDVRTEIDGWLLVRHAIVHGSDLPNSPLVSGKAQNKPSLHRRDAERCIQFFDELVNATADESANQFP